MQLNDKGEVIWEAPRKEVTDLYRVAIYQHLIANMDKHLQPEEDK